MDTRVYRNLNKPGYWSIKQKTAEGWQVVGHATAVQLRGATPYVSEATRLRMIKMLPKRGREVHAWLCGEVSHVAGFIPYKGRSVSVTACPASPRICQKVTYHPFECGFFFNVSDSTRWHQSPVVDLGADMSVYSGYVI